MAKTNEKINGIFTLTKTLQNKIQIKLRKIFPGLLLFFSFCVSSQENRVVTPHIDPSLKFTENKGQWESFIKYRAQMSGGMVYMEKDGITYDYYDKKKYINFHMGGRAIEKDPKIKAHAFKVKFLNCNPEPVCEVSEPGNYCENFFIGNDKSKWSGGVKHYHKIKYLQLYNGIDYEAITTISGIKYNFYVKPGADAKQIELKYTGVNRLKLINGELIITTSLDSIIEKKPYAYQIINGKISEVPCNYKLRNNTLAFDFPKGYARNYQLVIDPILVFAAQSGSTADNFGMTATYDSSGDLFTGGTVFANGYPTTIGAYDITFGGVPANGNVDVVITKYNPTGTTLLYSTYLGGTGSEIVTSLVVDANNNLFLYGATGSANFPTTFGAFDQTFNGGNYLDFYFNGTTFANGTDIYVAKLNPTGTSLLACTLIGGSDDDGVNYTNSIQTYTVSLTYSATPPPATSTLPCAGGGGVFSITEHKADSLQFNYGDQYRGEITLDKFGNVYIASSTRSSNFPILGGGFDNSLGGKQDAVVVKFNPNLTNVIWSSYLGGTENDAGYSLVVTDSLYAYVCGGTYSLDFPTKPGCYKVSYNGGKADGYIVKINPAGTAILKGTYVGTTDYDQTYFIQKNKTNDVYVYGQSLGNMPVTAGVYSNAGSHQFITRLDGQLSNVNMSTVFGSGFNKIDISPSAFSIDNCGNIYVSGWGGNIIYGPSTTNMPTTPGAFQVNTANGYDFYLMVLSGNAASLLYGTYFGGSCSQEHVDGGTSRFDPKGIIYQSVCAGCGNNEDFPVTPGAWPNTPLNHNKSSNCNNGVFKFDFQIKITIATLSTNTVSGCSPLTISFANNSIAYTSYLWNLGGGATDTTSQILNPIKTFTAPGNYTVTLVVKDTSSCNKIDSTVTYITVVPGIKANFTFTQVPCSDTVNFTNTSILTVPSTLANINWTFTGGATSTIANPTEVFTPAGSYTTHLVVTNNFGCKDSINKVIVTTGIAPSVAGSTICLGANANLTAGGGTSYSWTPTSNLNNPNIATPVSNVTTTTIYSVTITNTITNCVRTLTTQVTVNPKPLANFTYTINKCGGGVNFNDSSFAGVTNWQWNLGNLQTSVLPNPYQFYPAGGTFTIDLIVTNLFGCKDTINKTITVGAPPPVSVSATSTICVGGFIQLVATGGFAYIWQPAASLSGSTVANPVASPTTTTNYSVTIFTINGIGDTCKLLLTSLVNVTQVSTIPIAILADPDTVIIGNSSVLTVTASPGAVVSWLPQNSTVPTVGYSVTATPAHTTTYTAVISRGPCSQTVSAIVWVLEDGCGDADVYIPNTFTPNGDGANDVMYARGNKITTIYFAIYNRWGEMVFETRDKTVGWDGIYKERPADVGVFGYYVKVTCYNGLETFKKGNITLIR